jgi:hypothetical protein
MSRYLTELVDVAVTFHACIQEVPGSSLDKDIGYPDYGILFFLSSLMQKPD